jgi:uncharacterized lipoprotein YehR (DUF1307 family)
MRKKGLSLLLIALLIMVAVMAAGCGSKEKTAPKTQINC